jgi:pilus assembly protein CpaE
VAVTNVAHHGSLLMTSIPTAPLPSTGVIPVEVPTITVPSTTAEPPASMSARTSENVTVLLVEELEQVATRIDAMIVADRHVKLVETVADGGTAMDRISAVQPDVVIIDALMQGEMSGLRVAKAMRASGMTTPILFLTVPDLPVTVNADTGIAEVLMLPFEAEALRSAIIRVDDAHRGPVGEPLQGTVAVFSAKGGVGRTAIAHNLAVAMRRGAGARTVLVDGDQVHGDLRLHLEAPDDAPSLVQLPTNHVSAEDVKDLLWQDAAGLDILLAPPRMEQADLITLADIRRAHAMLQRMYDLVVIDVPTVMDVATLAILDDADIVLDVTTPRLGAVRKTQRCHAVLEAAGFPMGKVVTVVNHADAYHDQAAFAEALGWLPDAVLMHDERLAAGQVAAGSSIVSAHPEAPISRGFVELSELLIARVQTGTGALAAQAA